MREGLVRDGAECIAASRSRNRLLRALETLRACLWRLNDSVVAVVDVYSGFAFLVALFASHMLLLRHARVVAVLHGGSLPQFRSRHPLLVDSLLRRVHAIVTPSEYLARHFDEYSDKITIIANPIAVASSDYHDGADIKPTFLWLRSFHEIYNPEMAVRLLHELRERGIACRLKMVSPDKGDGAYLRTMDLAAALSLTDMVTFVPGIPKSKVPSYMRDAAIYLNTTHVDNMPVTVLEAMASGLAIVSTDVGGIPDLLAHGALGRMVPDNDHVAMADAVETILKHPAETRHMIRRARAKAEDHDISRYLEKWRQLFDKLECSAS